jgi:CBS domain-containing protein
LLSYLSNHSYLITVQILQAHDLEALRVQAERITRFVALLYRGGTRVGQTGKLVQALNAKLFERAWQLVAPAALVAESCLFVMGSEGRGEQLLKTDQDNGLVLRDGAAFAQAEVAGACERFSAALRLFGYPDCPGGIMVSNPAWRLSANDFSSLVRGWLLRPDPEKLMALAIFIDARAVTGDASLLFGVRAQVDRLVSADDALLGRFAAAIDSFPDPSGGWWNRLVHIGADAGEVLDLKKAGIFPIVHGVRSLALRDHVQATATAARLDALVAGGRLSQELASELVDSLHFLMGLKLEAGLAELDAQLPVSGAVRVDRLGSLERDLLKDALAVVKRFKALVRHQFALGAA